MNRKIITFTVILLILTSFQLNFAVPQTVTSNDYYDWIIEPKYGYVGSIYADEVTIAGIGVFPYVQYGIIDLQGNWIVDPIYGEMYGFDENGLVRTRVGDFDNGKYGYLDAKGNWAIKPEFDFIGSFSSNGLTLARVGDKWTGKYGFIDVNGDWVIKPIYEYAWDFNDSGLANVEYDGKWGLIDSKGNWIVKPQFAFVGYVAENGLAVAQDGNPISGKFGYIKKSGAWVIKPQFDSVGMFSSNGLATVKIGDKWGFINELGKVVISPKFDEVEAFGSNGLAEVTIYVDEDPYNRIAGYVDEKGNWAIKPEYYGVTGFNELGLATVRYGDYENGKWGCIDQKGNWIIKPIFESGLFFSADGYASVIVDQKWGVVKLKDSFIKELDYSNKGASSWAFEILDQAQNRGFVPQSLSYDYQNYITREEFCNLIINAYELELKKEVSVTNNTPFIDTRDEDVLKSYELGIVKGITRTEFKPQNLITREAMAVMLVNSLNTLEYNNSKDALNVIFSDENEISTWGKESVHKLYDLGIFSGTGNNRINPKGNVTREQAIILVYRLFNLFK